MKTISDYEIPSLPTFKKSLIGNALALLLLLLPLTAWAGGTVTNCTEAALRAAMAGGGNVTFACDGTITLTNTITNTLDAVLDGGGHQITISGNSTNRVFCVVSNINFTLFSLTIANGQSDNGAGIYNAGGNLTVQKCAFIGNTAIGEAAGNVSSPVGSNGCGGALYNAGFATIMNSTFSTNVAVGGAGANNTSWSTVSAGQSGCGAAVYNSGSLNIVDCSFAQNWARGGPGGYGMGNQFGTSAGGVGGDGDGGAICNLGVLAVNGSTFSANSASGGPGGAGGYVPISSAVPPINGGAGGPGGDGNGAALFNGGSASLINCTFALDSVVGAPGGEGGGGSPPIVPHPPYAGGYGGNGGTGGSAFGVICDTNGQVRLTNCTLAFNSATAGSGGAGGPAGDASAKPGSNGSPGALFGGLKTNGGELVNTLLAGNVSSNCLGSVTDAGHNLSSDASCAFTNVGSMNSTDPKLGPLADNGGPTLTMALLPGSPAIDAGDSTAAPPTDQRGVPRPFGLAADIGAFEFWPELQASYAPAGGMDIVASGIAGQPCRLLASSNLTSWFPMATNQLSTNGTALFHDDGAGGPCRFYRLVMP